MAERVVERTEKVEPRETVVVKDNDRVDRQGSNTGVIIAVVLLIIVLLLLIFGRGLFSGNGGTKTPTTNVTVPTSTSR